MSNPVLVVESKTAKDIYVSGDPNWDDQVLIINGSTDVGYGRVTEGTPATVSVDWGENPPDELMMGVIISEQKYGNESAYQLSIGVDPDSGKMGVAEPYSYGDPTIQYTARDQTSTSVTLVFTDK